MNNNQPIGLNNDENEPNTLYKYLLTQEVLDEAAQNIFNELLVFMGNYNLSVRDDTPYASLIREIYDFKSEIISSKNNDAAILEDLTSKINAYRIRVRTLINNTDTTSNEVKTLIS